MAQANNVDAQSSPLAGLEVLRQKYESTRKKISIKDKEERDKLLRAMYQTSPEADSNTSIPFFAQDKRGFPLYRIAETALTPVLVRQVVFDPSDWPSNLPPPNNLRCPWPPQLIADLLGSPDSSEPCLSCSATKACTCSYDTWTQNYLDLEPLFSIQPTPPIGHGLFANRSFGPETILGEYTGILQPSNSSNANSNYKARIDIGPLVPPDQHRPTAVINAEQKGFFFRFLNHSCNPNAEFGQARVGMGHRVLVVGAKRRIRAGEQVTLDYGDDWMDEGKPCHCGAVECRKPAGRAKRKRSS